MRVGKPFQGLLLGILTAAALAVTLFLPAEGKAGTNLAPFEDVGRLLLRARRGEVLSGPFLLGLAGIAGNLLLLAPWGFVAWKFLDSPGRPAWRVHLEVLLFGMLLSLGIETVQLFLPTRAADVNDVVWNVLGTAVGSLAAHAGRDLHLEWE